MNTLKSGQIKDEVTDRCGLMPGDSGTPRSYVPKNPENHENQHFLQPHWFSLHHSVCEKAKKWKKYQPDHSQLHSAGDQLIILEMGGFHTTGLVLRHLVFLTLCVCSCVRYAISCSTHTHAWEICDMRLWWKFIMEYDSWPWGKGGIEAAGRQPHTPPSPSCFSVSVASFWWQGAQDWQKEGRFSDEHVEIQRPESLNEPQTKLRF